VHPGHAQAGSHVSVSTLTFCCGILAQNTKRQSSGVALMTMHSAAWAAAGGVAAVGGLAEGSEVLTLAGIRRIEDLREGDRIVTRGGARALRGMSVCDAGGVRLVRVSAAALGHDRPEADIVLAADQPILVRDWRAKALAGQDRALIAAGRLVDGAYIRVEPCRPLRLWTLHFDGPAVIYAQGLELACVTLAAAG
jgi:hypothetical protein